MRAPATRKEIKKKGESWRARRGGGKIRGKGKRVVTDFRESGFQKGSETGKWQRKKKKRKNYQKRERDIPALGPATTRQIRVKVGEGGGEKGTNPERRQEETILFKTWDVDCRENNGGDSVG